MDYIGFRETPAKFRGNCGEKQQISVKVHDNNVGKAISKLKNILVNEGLFKELKDRKHYTKPSLKKKLKREEAEKQRQRDR